MSYPTDIPAFRDALLNYVPSEDHADEIYNAQAQASPVVQSVRVFEALKGAENISQEALSLLLGAAHLIASGGWHGLAGEAATVLATRVAELAA